MAVELTHVVDGQAPATKTTVYTVPANKVVTITSIHLTNTGLSNARTVNVTLNFGTGSRNISPKDFIVNPGATATLAEIGRIACAAGTLIEMEADVANEVDYIVSGIIQDV